MENMRHLLCGIYCSPLLKNMTTTAAAVKAATSARKRARLDSPSVAKARLAGLSAVAMSTESCLRLWGTCALKPALGFEPSFAGTSSANTERIRRMYPSNNPISFCEAQHDALLPVNVVVSDASTWQSHRLALMPASNDSPFTSDQHPLAVCICCEPAFVHATGIPMLRGQYSQHQRCRALTSTAARCACTVRCYGPSMRMSVSRNPTIYGSFFFASAC